MRSMLFLISLTVLSACATDDAISDRRYGQQFVCHKNHSMAVSTADSFVHLDHGDTMGPCPKDL